MVIRKGLRQIYKHKGINMLKRTSKLYFPRLVYVKKTILKKGGNKGKERDIYQLDWRQRDKIIEDVKFLQENFKDIKKLLSAQRQKIMVLEQ